MWYRGVICAALVVWAVSLSTAAAALYTGQLTWDQDQTQIVATNDWAAPPTSISWEVEQVGPWTWSYTYTLSVSGKDVSHFIIEASDNLDQISELEATVLLEGVEFGTYSASKPGKSNPLIPDPVYGLKFDLAEDTTTVTVRFTADRDPIWGDFYAMAGAHKNPSVAFNSGFTSDDYDPDPNVFGPDRVPVTDHILIPDTIPQPASLIVLCAGSAALLLPRRVWKRPPRNLAPDTK